MPPSAGIGIANYFSRKSRAKTGHTNEVFNGAENEWLFQYAKDVLELTHYDYFIFGHRHLPLNLEVNEKSRYINLGDWIRYYSYAEMEEGRIQLKYEGKNEKSED
jgi:UDP-2,3-diacylglucosamine hydrolase